MIEMRIHRRNLVFQQFVKKVIVKLLYSRVVHMVCFVCLIILVYYVIYDPCHSREITEIICRKYQEGLVVGSVCHDLCVQHTLHLGRCLGQDEHRLVFRSSAKVIHVTNNITFLRTIPQISPIALGTTLGQFRSLVRSYVVDTVGISVQVDLTQRLLNFADFNRNGVLSLNEARTLWDLLRTKDFLTLFIFNDHYHFPHINGTCANMIVLQDVFTTPIFLNSTLFSSLVPFSLFHLLPWTVRVKVSVGLLETVYDLYDKDGITYDVCEIHADMLAFDPLLFEGKIWNMSSIISRHSLERLQSKRTCFSDNDCVYSDTCRTICNLKTSRCTGVTTVSLLARLCAILEKYLLAGAPRRLISDLKYYFNKCIQLRNSDIKQELKTALIYNQLRMYLWGEVMWEFLV